MGNRGIPSPDDAASLLGRELPTRWRPRPSVPECAGPPPQRRDLAAVVIVGVIDRPVQVGRHGRIKKITRNVVVVFSPVAAVGLPGDADESVGVYTLVG